MLLLLLLLSLSLFHPPGGEPQILCDDKVIMIANIALAPCVTEPSVTVALNKNCTPLWEINRTISFNTNYSSFIFCSSFYSTYMGWAIWIMPIFIGFRSLVTSQWHFEKGNSIKTRCRVSLTYAVCMVDTEEWGNDRYWPIVRVQEVVIKYYELSKTCHKSIHLWLPGIRAVAKSQPRPQGGGLFYCLCLRGLTYRHRNANDASWDYGAVYKASTQVRVWILLHITESGLSYKHEGSHRPYQWNYCYIVSLVTCPRMSPYVDILIWSYP